MLKKTITYKDFDDNERTETLYFNLTEAEVMELELTTQGGLSTKIVQIVEAQKSEDIIKLFKEVILLAYGEKSNDGRYFNKSKEISDAFSHTLAYSSLFMELATSAEAATAFINGVLPKKISNPPPKSN